MWGWRPPILLLGRVPVCQRLATSRGVWNEAPRGASSARELSAALSCKIGSKLDRELFFSVSSAVRSHFVHFAQSYCGFR